MITGLVTICHHIKFVLNLLHISSPSPKPSPVSQLPVCFLYLSLFWLFICFIFLWLGDFCLEEFEINFTKWELSLGQLFLFGDSFQSHGGLKKPLFFLTSLQCTSFPSNCHFLEKMAEENKKEERGVLNRRERAFRCGRAEVTKDVEVTFLRLNVTTC